MIDIIIANNTAENLSSLLATTTTTGIPHAIEPFLLSFSFVNEEEEHNRTTGPIFSYYYSDD